MRPANYERLRAWEIDKQGITLQEPTTPRELDGDECRALTNAVRSLVQKSPEAKRVAEALAVWLRMVCDSAQGAPAAAASNGSPTAAAGHAAATTDEVGKLAEQRQPEVQASPAHAAAREEAMRAVLERWANPDVSPKIDSASPSREAESDPKPTGFAPDLIVVQSRLRMHQRACDWAVSCARFGFEDNKVEFRRLCENGKQSKIFFWELHQEVRDFPIAQWLDIRARYQAVDAAIGLYLNEPADNFQTTGVFRVLGFAVGALRSAMEAPRRFNLFDSDVEDLVRLCSSHPRHGDSLPSTDAVVGTFDLGGFLERISSIQKGIRSEIARKAAPQKALKKLAYHLRQCVEVPTDADDQVPPILAAITAFVEAGRPLTAAELLRVINDHGGLKSLPKSLERDQLGARLIAVIQNPAAHRDGQEDDDLEDLEDSAPSRIPTAELLAVREALQGKRMVIIGGDERPNRKAAIRAALGLSEVDWIATRPHEKHDSLIPPIRNPATAVVVLMIRWASHSYGDMCDVCERFGKPLVRLPGGYNPSMIAREVLEQAGKRLGVRGAN